MTNNSFQNPLELLQAKYKESWSGCIEITAAQDLSFAWQVYLLRGKIQYITTSKGKQARLDYLWHKYRLASHCPHLETSLANSSEYSQVCQWLESQQSDPEVIKKLLLMFAVEGITQVLSIAQAKIEFNPAKRIQKSVISFELPKFIENKQIKSQVESWHQAKSYCQSPLSRFYLEQKNALKFYKIWQEKYNHPELASLAKTHKLSSFVSLFVAKSTVYEIATKAKVDTYFLTQHLQSSIEEGIVTVLPWAESTLKEQPAKITTLESKVAQSQQTNVIKSHNSQTLIVCIDDSKTVQKQVKMTLEAVGYQVLGILDPTLALKELAQHQPAVIFMDINMPNVNGYDLCSLLRKSHKFQEVPIVMLTGRDGMIDRVRAKLVGANDYLTKPCDPHKLISLAKAFEKSTIIA